MLSALQNCKYLSSSEERKETRMINIEQRKSDKQKGKFVLHINALVVEHNAETSASCFVT